MSAFAPLAAATIALLAAAPLSAQREGSIRALRFQLDDRPVLHGVCYGPHRAGQSPGGAPPGANEILEDLRLISRHWRLLRMYDAAPSAAIALRLIREHRLAVRAIVGAWVAPEDGETGRDGNRDRVAAAIRLAREYPDLVVAVSIGNETQVHWSGHRCEPADLIRHLRAARAAVAQPVATADDFKFWTVESSRRVAAECDFVMLHAYALWNGPPASAAVPWTARVYAEVCRLHAGLPVVLAETGWATNHDPTRRGPGEEGTLIRGETSVGAQAAFLREFYAWVETGGVISFVFEAFDEPWKGRGPAGTPAEAEKNWGLFDSRRQPKAALSELAQHFLRPPAAR